MTTYVEMEENYENIADLLRDYMVRQNCTQNELDRRLGLSPTTVSQWVLMRYPTSALSLTRMHAKLKIDGNLLLRIARKEHRAKAKTYE